MKKRHEMTYEEIIAFHGHSCPGLLLGYRMARAAMTRIAGDRSEDEEIVAIVENDGCGVDALQCVTGCTFGKGNLIFRDYGKHAYTIFNRANGRAVRVSTSREQDEKRQAMPERCFSNGCRKPRMKQSWNSVKCLFLNRISRGSMRRFTVRFVESWSWKPGSVL